MKKTLLCALLCPIALTAFISLPAVADPPGSTPYNFSNDSEIPQATRNYISKYVDKVMENRKHILNSMNTALANFDTSMHSASTAEAESRVMEVMVSAAFKQAISAAVSKVPGLLR